MKRHLELSILFLMLGLFTGWSQKVMILSNSADRLMMLPARIKDSVQRDVEKFSIRYRFTRANPEADTTGRRSEILMQIGGHMIKQTDVCLYYDNLIYTNREPGGALSALRKQAGIPSNLFTELYINRTTGEMKVLCGDYFSSNVMKTYTQPAPDIEWRLRDSSKTVAGYKCQQADGELNGRTWHVWYTTEIPVPFGPWKLHGLPGLILSATDGENFAFECQEILRGDKPITETRFDGIQDIRTLKNYLRYERNCYEHPYQTFANGEDAIVVASDKNGKSVYLDQNWTIPYTPIEFE